MRLSILAYITLFSGYVLAATPTSLVVTCVAPDTTSIVIQKIAPANKLEAPTYLAQLRMADEKAIAEFKVSKMIFSRGDSGPLAVVYISSELTLTLPIAPGGADKLETEPRATLELPGHPQAWEMVCR
jgi:hypothetical protein